MRRAAVAGLLGLSPMGVGSCDRDLAGLFCELRLGVWDSAQGYCNMQGSGLGHQAGPSRARPAEVVVSFSTRTTGKGRKRGDSVRITGSAPGDSLGGPVHSSMTVQRGKARRPAKACRRLARRL